MTVDGLTAHEPVTLAFWECGYIEVDVGREHPCDGRDVCVASYRRYVPEPLRGAVDVLRGVLSGRVVLDETEGGEPILLDLATDPATVVRIDRLGRHS